MATGTGEIRVVVHSEISAIRGTIVEAEAGESIPRHVGATTGEEAAHLTMVVKGRETGIESAIETTPATAGTAVAAPRLGVATKRALLSFALFPFLGGKRFFLLCVGFI